MSESEASQDEPFSPRASEGVRATPPPSPSRVRVRAVLFDVDGTLYHQQPLRLLMAAELAALPIAGRSLRRARTTWSVIGAFRRVREELRNHDDVAAPLDDLQYVLAAERSGVSRDVVEATVSEWIYRRPLKHLRRCRRRGFARFLASLRKHAIAAGAFSDYPVKEKLAALGVASHFSVSLSATDPEVNAFKPHARGFLRACELFGVPPGEVLYVGDRVDVDAGGAAASGMSCAILSRGGRTGDRLRPSTFINVRSFGKLQDVLDSHR